jgi:hypothetical protein
MAARNSSPNEFTPNFTFARAQYACTVFKLRCKSPAICDVVRYPPSRLIRLIHSRHIQYPLPKCSSLSVQSRVAFSMTIGSEWDRGEAKASVCFRFCCLDAGANSRKPPQAHICTQVSRRLNPKGEIASAFRLLKFFLYRRRRGCSVRGIRGRA